MADNRTEQKVYGVYHPSILSAKLILSPNEIGNNLKSNLEKMIRMNTEGRCIAEGYIQPDSVRIGNYSAGNLMNGSVEFQSTYECMVCHPVEGMIVECLAKTITKAGVHAEITDNLGNTPVTVFIARDHHANDKRFSEIKENAKIKATVIGVRYELNDPYICVIASLKAVVE